MTLEEKVAKGLRGRELGEPVSAEDKDIDDNGECIEFLPFHNGLGVTFSARDNEGYIEVDLGRNQARNFLSKCGQLLDGRPWGPQKEGAE
jgi:hypothetical protein